MTCRKAAIWPAFTVLLLGCGGGGGGSSSSTAPDSPDTGGTPPSSGTPRLVSATAEKGPFVIGSSVTVNRLDSNADPTTTTLTTETEDDLGNFSFSIEPGPVSISVDGFHFNEITGKLATGRLTLRAIYEVQDNDSQRAHVNLLTHLIHLRVERLVQSGSTIPEAIQTAQTELVDQLSPFFGPFSPESFTDYSVYASDSTTNEGAAYILAVSASIYQFAINRGGPDGFDAELAQILNSLSDDFADGVVDLQWILDGINAASVMVDPESLSANLLAHAESIGFTATPADAGLFIDSDRDGIVNTDDPDDDNDGVADVDDGAPLNAKPSIQGVIARHVIKGHWYEAYLTASDPDEDPLQIIPEGLGGDFHANFVQNPAQEFSYIPLPDTTDRVISVLVGIDPGRPTGVAYPVSITISDGYDEAVWEGELEFLDPSTVPVLLKHPPTVGIRGETYSSALVASNPRSTALSWRIEKGPDWLAIDQTTGQLSGTIPVDHRITVEPYESGGFTPRLQNEYCRSKRLVDPRYCAHDVVTIAIDDGTVETFWPIYIDFFDFGETQGPVIDGNPFHESLPTNVHEDSAGNVYVVGSIGGAIDGNGGLGSGDAFVKKLNSRQVEQWTRQLGTPGVDHAVASEFSPGDGVYVYILSDGDWSQQIEGASDVPGTAHILMRLSPSGEQQWVTMLFDGGVVTQPQVRGVVGVPMDLLPEGGVRALVNGANQYGGNTFSGEIIDISPIGNRSQFLSIDLSFDPKDIAVAPDGTTAITGEDALVVLNPEGSIKSSGRIDPSIDMILTGRSTEYDAEGNLYIAGDLLRSALDGRGWFVTKYSPDGTRLWINEYTVDDEQKFHDIGPNGLTVSEAGQITVAGRVWLESFTASSNGGDYDTVISFNANGNLTGYKPLWRPEPEGTLSIIGSFSDGFTLVGNGTEDMSVEYPGQFECTDENPCSRGLRVARNGRATLDTGDGGHDYYLVQFDADGNER